jgi:Sel1 repeat
MCKAWRRSGPDSEGPWWINRPVADEIGSVRIGVIRPRQGTGRIEAVDPVRHTMVMAPMRKRKILPKLMAIAALCFLAQSRASAQTAPAIGADSGKSAVEPQSQNLVTLCDRYTASEFDSQSPGLGMPFERIDPKVAIPACSQALSKNPDSPRLNFELGRAYSARGEFSKARDLFLKAAEANFALAEVDLGSFYFNGLGAPRNDEEAVKWDRLAADQGLAPAESNLGIMYLEGRGVRQDFGEAAKWLQAAAWQGFAPAEYSLAALYASGKGVKPNFAEARRLYGQAANQGYAPAEAGFPWTEAEGQSFDRRYGEAGQGGVSAAGEEAEPGQPTPDKLTSNEPGDARAGPADGSDEGAKAPPSSPANTPSPSEPGARLGDPVAIHPSADIFLQGRLEGEASGGDRPAVNIVVKLLDHRNSSGVPTVAIEVSPRSNQFSLSSLSVNNGACRVYTQDPSIFTRGRGAGLGTADGGSDFDRGGRNLAAALEKISLPRIPFDQPMAAEFGQYLQFYVDPSACDVRQAAVVVNGHEWLWRSTGGAAVAADPKPDDRMAQSPNPGPEAKP